MGFRAQRAKRNTRRDQPFADIGDAFHRIHIHFWVFTFEIQQIAQIHRPLPGDQFHIFFPAGI